jgi:hypothetical protein
MSNAIATDATTMAISVEVSVCVCVFGSEFKLASLDDSELGVMVDETEDVVVDELPIATDATWMDSTVDVNIADELSIVTDSTVDIVDDDEVRIATDATMMISVVSVFNFAPELAVDDSALGVMVGKTVDIVPVMAKSYRNKGVGRRGKKSLIETSGSYIVCLSGSHGEGRRHCHLPLDR